MMERYRAQGTRVVDTLTGENASFLSDCGAQSAADGLNREEVDRTGIIWDGGKDVRYVADGKSVIDLAWDRAALFDYGWIAADYADRLNDGTTRASALEWQRRSELNGKEKPRYVVDISDPDSYKVRDTVGKRYAPFSSEALTTAIAYYLNNGEDSERFGWITDATHEELSRKDEPEPELEEWELELLASCGIVEIPERRFTAEVYTDGVDGGTYGIVRDSSNDTFAPMDSPFDAAVWAQRLNADKMESRKLAWLGMGSLPYFE